jgi:hypothetical protein
MTERRFPSSLLVWTLTDAVLEQPSLLLRQFHDIRNAGFGGVAPWVRCSRYTWADPLSRQAHRQIGRLCRRHRMALWIGPDPRFISHELADPGLECLLFGDSPRAERFPNFATSAEGAYTVRCSLAPRHVHTLNEVAIEYRPLRLAGVYAFRAMEPGPHDILDLTPGARMFHNARDLTVEAFGTDRRLARGSWKVMAFFHVRTNHVDFSDRRQMARYLSLLRSLKEEGIVADGVMWDEPGFTCTYGTLPYSDSIRRRYRRRTGRPIERDLWKLAVDAPDGSHARIRIDYYREIQRGMNDANRAMTRLATRLWGPETVSGIHDTWHFESGDMCDMNHGSLDLWEGMRSKTGGFVDLGGVDQLRWPDSPWYANLAAMSVAAASLGKYSRGGYAYNNLWTVGDDNGEGWQRSVLDHCANVIALFGTRWLAHAYGPVGTIGEERTFLGSPPLPGYPDHSTWGGFPEWNRRLSDHLAAVGGNLPWSNLLLLFPTETLYALADQRADRVAGEVFHLILSLLDHHYHVEFLSPALSGRGRWEKGEFVIGRRRYRGVISPYPGESVRNLFRGKGPRTLFTIGGSTPRPSAVRCGGPEELLERLGAISPLRPVTPPAGTWCTLTPCAHGKMITLIPSRHGLHYSGCLRFGGKEITVPERSGLCRIFAPEGEDPLVLTPEHD